MKRMTVFGGMSPALLGVVFTLALSAQARAQISSEHRASIGKNFTNSVGIDLVWVPLDGKSFPEGGFWIGRREVTQAAFQQILPQAAANCSTDPGGLLYRVLWSEAVKFCSSLTAKETSETVPNGGTSAPAGWSYRLPSSGVWNYAMQNAETLGLLNFEGGVSEFLSDRSRGGLHTVFGTSPGAESAWYRKPLPVPENRDLRSTGAAIMGEKGGTMKYHEGRVGFRIVLVKDS